MTTNPSSSFKVNLIIIFVIFSTKLIVIVNGLGSTSTIAVSYGSGTVCGILAGKPRQGIQCYMVGNRNTIYLNPNISYDSISGGENFFCGLKSGGFSFFCWNWNSYYSFFQPKRIYYSKTIGLRDLTVGDTQVCALEKITGIVHCWWRGERFRLGLGGLGFSSPQNGETFKSITCGKGFSCGISKNNNEVHCWGINSKTATQIQKQFQNISMMSLVAGDSHVCGLNFNGFLICKGMNNLGQLDIPFDSKSKAFDFSISGLALGMNHSCGIRSSNGSVICWGGNGKFFSNEIESISFESVVAGLNFTCGLTTRNLSLICWGPGWDSKNPNQARLDLPLSKIIPGSCTQSSCSCGIYPNSENLCSGSENICKQCEPQRPPFPVSPPSPPPPLPPPPPTTTKSNSIVRNRALLVFAIVGSVGALSGIFSIIYCLWAGVCFGQQKIHNSVQPTISGGDQNVGSDRMSPSVSRSSTFRRQSSRMMRRQRSGPSSKHADRAEEFSFSELAIATNGFSLENKIGSGSFGIVYRGKLSDGREVAIKRGEISKKTKKFQEKESAFESELSFLSRLHHKHLVSLVGFCEENEERLLVYEYMKNGALYDHLHSKNNTEKSSDLVNSWRMRIKISLDAARGIEYLHNYAVPPIIHRDIKSSNILIDSNWVARVSDFGLSLMGPESEEEYMSAKAAGTVGYMDPEYYSLNVLTAKSDVYGLGVVLLELLTGRKAIFKNDEEDGGPISIVDFAEEKIMAGEVERILDERVGSPNVNEVEAVELMAYIAAHCVKQEGKDRPSMSDIVGNLERALALCDGSHGSISSGSISVASY